MKISRICDSLLLVPLMLVISGCASSASYVKKGPEVKTNTVKINNCKSDPDTVLVPRGETLTWKIDPPDGHTYSIKFTKRTPLASSTATTAQDQKVTGEFWCNTFGAVSTKLCVYEYNLIQDGSTTCPDPGVHVGPGGP